MWKLASDHYDFPSKRSNCSYSSERGKSVRGSKKESPRRVRDPTDQWLAVGLSSSTEGPFCDVSRELQVNPVSMPLPSSHIHCLVESWI